MEKHILELQRQCMTNEQPTNTAINEISQNLFRDIINEQPALRHLRKQGQMNEHDFNYSRE